MSDPIRLSSASAALAVLLVPQIACAEVTADDVWQNLRDYTAVFSPDYSSTPTRDGDTLKVPVTKLAFDLPFEFGQVSVSFSGFSMTEQGDGTVALNYPNPAAYGVTVDIFDKGSFAGKLLFSHQGLQVIASGKPGDITYAYSVDHLTMTLTDLDFEKSEMVNVIGRIEIDDLTGASRIEVGNAVRVSGDFSAGAHSYLFSVDAPDDTGLNASGGGKSMTGTTDMTLPRGGMDIANLAAALRDGLALKLTSQIIGYETSQSSRENGQVISSQRSRSQEQNVGYEVDLNGIRMTGDATDIQISGESSAEIPFPILLYINQAKGGVTLPLSASSDLQDVSLAFSLQGLSMADDMWSLFDPNQALPREPATITLDLDAKVRNLIDWMDFATVKALDDSGEMPVEIHALTLNRLVVDMAGTRLSGAGRAAFDNSDMTSFGGFPKPSGTLDLGLVGANTLMDTLVKMGLVSQSDVTGARMMLSVIAEPDPDAGDDAMKSRLELTEEGHILANGQRIK